MDVVVVVVAMMTALMVMVVTLELRFWLWLYCGCCGHYDYVDGLLLNVGFESRCPSTTITGTMVIAVISKLLITLSSHH